MTPAEDNVHLAGDNFKSWRSVEASEAEGRLRNLKQRLLRTEETIELQSSLLRGEPESFAYQLALHSLIARRDAIQAEIAELSAYRVKEQLRLSLSGQSFPQNSAHVDVLAHVLFRAQRLFTSIVQAISVGPTARGPIPLGIERITQLRLAQTFPSSFGMILEAETNPNAFGNSTVAAGLASLFVLLESSEDRDQLVETAGSLGPRVMNHYRKLVGQLVKTGSELSVSWKDLEGQQHQWAGTSQRLQSLSMSLKTIRTEETEIRERKGRIVGASLLRDSFEFLVTETDEVVRGRISNDARVSVQQLFGKPSIGFIAETLIRDDVTGDERTVATLTRLLEQ